MQIINVEALQIKDIIKERMLDENSNIEHIDRIVKEIIQTIRKEGEEAVFNYVEKLDGVRLNELLVTEEEIERAFSEVDSSLINILEKAKQNIKAYHEEQKEKSWYTYPKEGVMLGQQLTSIERVGVYVPGGKAAYPSTVLMNVIPAKVAGVRQIVVTTPVQIDGTIPPATLVAAKIAGADQILKAGGAHGIATLAYGTEKFERVHKIVGPGNAFVARAKKYVFGDVGIDMIAGPSEVCVIADEAANPRYIASDLLAQAEHDELASSILITNSKSLAEQVSQEVDQQLKRLPRKAIAQKSIESRGAIYVVPSLNVAFDLANELAPEHLELLVKGPHEQLSQVTNAGAIFLGEYSPEPLGDYFAGPNHTLPTNGTAKFSSPLGVYDFMKKSSVIYYNKQALKEVEQDIQSFARKEGLHAHAESISIRFKDEK